MGEIKKSGLTFRQAKKLVDACIRDVKDGFVATGYYLWVIREERLWKEDGYNSFPEFLHCQYQKDKSWASRCIGLYEQFGKEITPGELPVLAAPYRDYSVSQLIEMVSMTEEQREQVTPDMKIREIREMKPKRKKKAAAALEGEVLAEAAGGEPEEQIPGQMELASYTEGSCDAATGEGRETSQEAQKPPKEAEVTRTTLEPKKGQETAQEALEGVREPDGDGATRVCAYREGFFCSLTREQQKTVGGKENCHVGCCWECESREECNLECISSASREETVAAEEEPLSAHGTPGKVYPEGSLIATAGYESKPGGPKGGYDCFSCARECEIRQKDRYCVEAPLGNPFPCGRMDVAGTLREAMGDRCQFVNLELAYHSQGDHEPVPCCRECKELCPFRCEQEKNGLPGAGRMSAEPGLVENPDQGQPELPNFRNDDQRKAWIEDYKAWGLWYRDEHIDVNYYKFDFPNGSRLVAVEYLQRESIWNSCPYDDVVYHLIEKNKQKYGCMTTYDDKFQYHSSCETELVKYLKKIQKKGGKE